MKPKKEARKQGNLGSVQLLFCVLTLLLFSSGVGAWKLFDRWNSLVQNQLRLDECVGSYASELSLVLNKLDDANKIIAGAKGIVVALALVPGVNAGAATTARGIMQGAVRVQQFYKLRWQARQKLWTSRLGCRKLFDRGPELPSLSKFRRLPPDPTGPGILSWEPTEPDAFWIQLKNGRRASSAIIKRGEAKNDEITSNVTKGLFSFTRWKATWKGTKRDNRTNPLSALPDKWLNRLGG